MVAPSVTSRSAGATRGDARLNRGGLLVLVDDYRFLPRSFASHYDAAALPPGEDAPVWAPFQKRLADARVTFLSSAGLYLAAGQQPFDVEREKREPVWGDPSYRILPASLRDQRLGVAHLHFNPDDVLADPNIAMPLDAAAELVDEGILGGVTPSHVSVMGYQEEGLRAWRDETAPALVALLREQGSDGIILAPI